MLAWISLNSRCDPPWQANSQTETKYPKSARMLQWNNLGSAAVNSLKGDKDGFAVQTPKALLEIKIEVILNRSWEKQDLYTQSSPLHRAKNGSPGLYPAFLQSCRHEAAEVLQCSCFCKQLQGSQEMFAEILRGTILSGNCQGIAFCLISFHCLAQELLERGHFLFLWHCQHLLLLFFRAALLLSSSISFPVHVRGKSASGKSKILPCYFSWWWQTAALCALESDLICHSEVLSSRCI